MGRDLLSRRTFLTSLGVTSAHASFASPAARAESAKSSAANSPGPGEGLARAEDFLLAPGLAYLQTASLGPTPRPVIEKTLAAWKKLEENPTFYGYGELERAMDDVRGKAAAFLGAGKEEIVLTGSTTEGMNWVAEGLSLATGDRVLTSDQEHPGGRVCWDHTARRRGVLVDVVPIPPGENDARAIVERFSRALTPRTRVLSFAHVLSSTGLRMPVAELSALARAHDCVSVVDGAQAAGGLAVDVKALGCDVYATSGHKWLLGPKGTGLLYLSNDLRGAVAPIALQGGRAPYSESSGFRNLPGILGLGAALDYLSVLDVARVEAHNLALRGRLYEALTRVSKLRVVSPPSGPLASPLLTWALPDAIESRAFQLRLLEKHQVMLKMVPKQWLNGNRASLHVFNTVRDVDRLLGALAAELSGSS